MNKIKSILRDCASARSLFFLTIVVICLPNVALCFTERMGIAACVANVLLPVGVVWLLMTLNRCPGKMAWALFLLVFFAAFQLVLLYLFGHSIIAVDMFLNLVTTNPGEALELLDNLIPAVAFVVVVYVPVLVSFPCAGRTVCRARSCRFSGVLRPLSLPRALFRSA